MHLMGKTTKLLTLAAGGLLLILSMLYMAGVFRTGLIKPGTVGAARTPPVPERTTTATVRLIPQMYEAVGTIRARSEASIASQVSGRVLSVSVREGDSVREGELLARIDSREWQARAHQSREALRGAAAQEERAREALKGAEAVHAEAQSRRDRVKHYFQQEVATRQDLEQVEAAYGTSRAAVGEAAKAVAAARAEVERARRVEEEALVGLDHTAIKAPHDGQVARRMVDPGDMAWPGKPLLVLQSPKSLQLEAQVREGLIGRVGKGARLPVVVDALGIELEGIVEEIVPSGNPATRSFLVKASVPAVEGLLPGMFGRLLVPLDERRAVLVDREAVRRIGQMEVVRVEAEGRWVSLFVKTGREIGDLVEVLSGLQGNEKVALEALDAVNPPDGSEVRVPAAEDGRRGRP